MRVREVVGWALMLGSVTGCGEENKHAGRDVQDIESISQPLCVPQRLTPTGVAASSVQSTTFPPSLAIDGNASTRWSSAFADPQWLQLDLGARRQVSRVVLNWELAASKSYTLALSDSASGPFTTTYSETNGNGGVDEISGLNALGRYLRLTSTARTTAFGNSLFEVEVYGDPSPSCGATVCGNAVVEAGEQCDDGNLLSSDACTTTCKQAACGDGFLRSGVEACDDGNVTSGDGCSAGCALEAPSCVEQALPRVSARASSTQNATFPANLAIDGDPATRWSSGFSDPQWIDVDLGAPRHISRVNLRWETAASKSYQLQVASESAGPWTTLYADTNGNGGVDGIGGLNGAGRYLRVSSLLRTTAFGVSLFEVEVYGDPRPSCGAVVCGNGLVDPGEACDDGNTTNGDGCSAQCATESPGGCGSTRIPLTGATASSVESPSYPAAEAIDGVVQTGCNAANRWSSASSDPQWLQVDLGGLKHVERVVMRWECAASASYELQVASNATGPWATVYADSAADGGVDDVRGLNATGRYVRLYSRARTTALGVSLYEIGVYGDPDPACGATTCTNPAPGNTTSLVIARPDIGARASGTTLRNAVRIAQNPLTGKVYVLSEGNLRELSLASLDSTQVVAKSAISGELPAGTSLGSVQGMAFGPEGNLYLVANQDLGNTNVGLVVKGTPSGATWQWSLLARTDEAPDSNTPFDHHWNGVVVSPDGQYVYVASGSRTDHGEAQSLNGNFPNTREVPLTSSLFRLPTNASSLRLPNTDAGLVSYLFAKGLRNSFDPAFAPDGKLLSGDNGPDSDYDEELNWIRQGQHYGFPWRLGREDNAMQLPTYDPAFDKRLRPGYFGIDNGFYYNDPAFPPKPAGLVDPIVSRGPDADFYRNGATGGIVEASAVGGTISTFSGHRSPLGLSFDVTGRLCGDLKQQGFILSFGAAVIRDASNDMFPDPGRDLLALKLIPTPASLEVEVRKLVSGFTQPIDSLLLGGKLYVIEFGNAGRVFEISLPVSG